MRVQEPPGGAGLTWTAVEDTQFDSSDSITYIAYGGDRFVAIDANCKVAYSTDGINWTAGGDTPFGSDELSVWGIAYGGGKFVTVGYNGKEAYSPDGITWTAVEAAQFDTEIIWGPDFHSIAYGDGAFVATGEVVAHSTDGINWTLVANAKSKFNDGHISGSFSIDNITYGDGKFVAEAEGWAAYTTDHGETWSTLGDIDLESISGNIRGIAYGGGKFVAVSAYGRTSYSTNGINWTVVRDTPFDSPPADGNPQHSLRRRQVRGGGLQRPKQPNSVFQRSGISGGIV